MTCDEIQDLIEPIAAGEQTPSEAVKAHLRTCPYCNREFAKAQDIITVLTQPIAAPPRCLTTAVVQRIHASEELIDPTESWFDTTAAISMLPIGLGIALLMSPGMMPAIFLALAMSVAVVVIALGLMMELS